MVRVVGVEPTRISSQEPKSCASANSAIPANMSGRTFCRCFIILSIQRIVPRRTYEWYNFPLPFYDHLFYTARRTKWSIALSLHRLEQRSQWIKILFFYIIQEYTMKVNSIPTNFLCEHSQAVNKSSLDRRGKRQYNKEAKAIRMALTWAGRRKPAARGGREI